MWSLFLLHSRDVRGLPGSQEAVSNQFKHWKSPPGSRVKLVLFCQAFVLEFPAAMSRLSYRNGGNPRRELE